MKIIHEVTNISMFLRPPRKICKTFPNFHWHENIEFLQILSDGFKILVDGELFKTKKGDIIFIGEHSIHGFIVENDNVAIRLGQFPISVVLGVHTELKPIKTHIRAEEISSDSVFAQQIEDLLSIMERTGEIKAGEETPFNKSVYSAFYYALMAKFPQEEHSKAFKKEKQDFYKIVEYINNHFTENITIISISKSLYIDRGRLSRIFLKYSGITVNLYINRLRINKANEFLKNGFSITEAALESGFQSIRSFNYNYKKVTGITPSEHLNESV